MRVLLPCVLVGLLVAPVAPAESLAQVAQRERERRAKLKSEGVRGTPVVDEQALKGNQGRLANDPGALPAAQASPSESAGSRPSATPGAAAEATWRQRMAEARASLARMTKQYEQLARAHLATGEYFVDPETGENLIGSPARLQKLVAEAKQEMELAQQRLETLEERARRERVPAGWLR